MQKVAILFNPSSGRGRSIRKKDKIERCLNKNGINYDIFITKSEKDLIELSKKKILNYKIVVGVGGDTTINIIATETMKRHSQNKEIPALGMIGTGSVNDIAQGLGILTIEDACRAIKNNKIERMDVGYVKTDTITNPIFFLGNLSSGLGTSVNLFVENFNKNHKKVINSKFFNQIFPGLLGIRHSFNSNIVPIKILLEYNNVKKEVDYSLIAFLNTPCFADGMKLSPGASPYDGILDCCIIKSSSFLNSVILGILAHKSLHINRKETHLIKSNLFRVSADEPLDFQVDGQVVKGVREFEVSLMPKALGILAS